MNDRKVILTIGPQFSGTKLTDSVFKTLPLRGSIA